MTSARLFVYRFRRPLAAASAALAVLLLASALRPASGEVRLDEQDPWQVSAARLKGLRGRLFLAPQVPPLPPRQRVVTAVLAGRLPAQSLWASLRSLVYPSDIPAAHDALAHFDLADKLFDRVDRLSGGERQRVGLSRALLAPAALWLIDEPLSSLDPTRAQQAIRCLVDVAHINAPDNRTNDGAALSGISKNRCGDVQRAITGRTAHCRINAFHALHGHLIVGAMLDHIAIARARLDEWAF